MFMPFFAKQDIGINIYVIDSVGVTLKEQITNTLIEDLLLAIGSFLFVFLCVWFHTRSFFLASIGFCEV